MDILQVLEGLAYVGFIAGAIFAVIELRTMSRARRTDLLLRTLEQWCTREFEEVAAKFMKAKFNTPEEAEEQMTLPSLMMIGDYYDFVGFMVKNKLVPKKLILDIMPIEYTWDKIKPWARGEEIDDQMSVKYRTATFRYFAWLADEKRKYRLAVAQNEGV